MTDKIGRTKITSADCVLPEMTGKFDLVFYTSQRARALVNGSPALVEGFANTKNHAIMIALEEIRQKKLTFNDMVASLASPNLEQVVENNSYIPKDTMAFSTSEEEEDEDGISIDYRADEEYED